MSLQDIFYLVNIIGMVFTILFFVSLLVLILIIRKKVMELVNNVEKKIDDAKNIMRHPQKIASSLGEVLIDTAIDQVTKMAHKKRVGKN